MWSRPDAEPPTIALIAMKKMEEKYERKIWEVKRSRITKNKIMEKEGIRK
jgi:hypothetical protein